MPLNNQVGLQGNNPYGVGSYPMTAGLDTVNVTGGISDSGAGQFGAGTGMTGFSPMIQNIGIDPVNVGASEQAAVNAGNNSGGFDWSSILSGLGSVASGVGNFLTSPLGSSAALIGLGQYEAGQAQKDTKNLTSQLTGPAQGFVQGGVNEQALAQKGLTGTPVTDGSIGQQEQAAAAAGQIAVQDMQAVASGKLPDVYEQQVQQQIQAQQQQIRAQLASQGITDASVISMYDQQIQNNANQQRQSILNNLQTQGAQAQQMVQQTYTNLLNDSIAQFGAGMGPVQDAVNLTVQQNTQIANGLQSLFGQIARGFAGATGGGAAGGTGAGTGGSPINQIVNGARQMFGGGNTAGITSDINSAIGADYSSLGSDLAASTASQEASVAGDVASSNLDWLSGGGFSSAGGGAAGAMVPSTLGEYSFAPGLSNVTGSLGSGLDAAAASSSASTAGADTGGALGGGASADAAAWGSAAQWGGAIAAPFALANEVSTWQSGATGQDALSGAETGAAIGTAIMPGIGTAIGAVGGAIAGGISSLFGGGKVDPENTNFEKYTQAFNKASPQQKPQVAAAMTNPYLPLAGYFDLRSGQLKGQNPIYQTYGRMGEQKFTNDLINKVKQGQQSGIKDSTQMWNQVVQPWINSMGTWQDSNKDALTALMQNMTGQVMAGTYKQNFKAIGGDTVFS